MPQGQPRRYVLVMTAALLLLGCGRRLTADVVAGSTGIPMSVSGTIAQADGQPATGVNVTIHTPQADHFATTDGNGDFHVNTGVPRIDGITVEGWGTKTWGWQPKCDRGLRLKLVVRGTPVPAH